MKRYKKIFVVDDDEVHNFVTKRLIRQYDKECEVSTHSNPEQAFELLKNTAENELPEILLLDINMPGMDGFEFLKRMQEGHLTEKIQTIMYSSSTYNDDKMRAKSFPNVIGYLEKPFSPEKYGEILEMGFVQ